MIFFLLLATIFFQDSERVFKSREAEQWYPFQEWTVTHANYDGNSFDLIAQVTFVHQDSGEQRRTYMFYAGGDTWKFRFTATQTGVWTFYSKSSEPELDGWKGRVKVKENPSREAHGFMNSFGHHWGWQGTNQATVPQFIMYKNVNDLYDDTPTIDKDLDEWFDQHGFNGLHVPSIAMG